MGTVGCSWPNGGFQESGAEHMRNIWKGLIVGGLTGAVAGLVLDGLNWGAERAGTLGDQVIHRAPEVASKVLGGAVSEDLVGDHQRIGHRTIGMRPMGTRPNNRVQRAASSGARTHS